jgi:peptidoglycan hydrolase FlgJ
MNINPLNYLDTNSKIPDVDQKKLEEQKVGKLAEDFESLFLGTLFKSMRQSVQESDLMTSGHGGDLFKSLLDEEYAKLTAANGSTGIASMITRDLMRTIHDQNQNAMQVNGEKAYKK